MPPGNLPAKLPAIGPPQGRTTVDPDGQNVQVRTGLQLSPA